MLAAKGFAIRNAGDASISNRKPTLRRNMFMPLNAVCGDCGRSFTSLQARQQHMNALGHRSPEATGGTSSSALQKCPANSVSTSSTILNNTRWTATATVAHVTDLTYAVTDRAYNSLINAWECYLCHRAFNLRSSLNQHLNSPAHQQALYHCPSTRCGREFSMAGGLFNHLESETCGAMRFDDVQRHAQAMMNPDRLLNYY
ncbi:hypothetical protein EV126DRAFT_443128 [Verticillium dahliae]|nr:hypothetical protein EV126DRAFT_443128 [Verticillium dahliae]